MTHTDEHTVENDAPCPTCGSGETWVSYEDPTANYCGACRSYFRVIPSGNGATEATQ